LKSKLVKSIILVCFLLGFIYYLVQQHRLVVFFNFPKFFKESKFDVESLTSKQQNYTLYFWKNDKFFSEESSVVWSSDSAENLKNLVNAWLSFAYQNKFMDKKVVAKSVSLTQSGQEVYVSFDGSPISLNWPIFKKWHFMEGLLKTIRESGVRLNLIYFREKNMPLEDEQLDFSQGWPAEGYIRN